MVDAIRTKMTSREFLALPETNKIMELIDGEVFMSPAPVEPHQSVIVRTTIFLGRNAPSGIILVAPLDVVFDDRNTLQPDVLWISDSNDHCIARDGKRYGAPDLIVEVLSPSTADDDFRKKYLVYQKYGVREYWIVHPQVKSVNVYRLEQAEFALQGTFGLGELFVSAVLGDITVDVTTLLG